MSGMGDIDEIQQVKFRYLRALDTKHWDEFADTLTEDVVGKYGESIGEEHHLVRAARTRGARISFSDELVVATSSRTRSRVRGGFASVLDRLQRESAVIADSA